jgi:hypothetical protein
MYGELYQYLILHKQLAVPGIGTFLVEKNSAEVLFTEKAVKPPYYSISLQHGLQTPSLKLFQWLAAVFNIGENDAENRFNHFAANLKGQVEAGNKTTWPGVGVISKGLAGEIRFESAMKNKTVGQPVKAEKVLRQQAEHSVRVGEQEKTAAEMIELLNPAIPKKTYWWMAALIITGLSIFYTAYYFYTHGFTATAAGNQQPVEVQKSASTYKLLP